MYKNSFNMDQRREIRGKAIEFLEENMGGKLHDSAFGNDLLDMT